MQENINYWDKSNRFGKPYYFKNDKKALNYWNDYTKQVIASTAVDANETKAQQRKRIARLEANPEEWFTYYFPEFAFAEPAQFHIEATKRVLAHKRWYEVRAWSRELAKSTRTMMEVLYLALAGKRFNVLMISNSQDNAERLLHLGFMFTTQEFGSSK